MTTQCLLSFKPHNNFMIHECPLSILRMVYAEVVLGKLVDWMTIHIQPKSNMKAPLQSYFPKGRKYPSTSLGKMMPSKMSENELEM
jgi:hypothetical protein